MFFWFNWGSRAKARTEGVRHVSTEWFMFVDGNVMLCKDSFKKVQGHLADGVGAIWGLNVEVLPKVRDKRIQKFQMFIAIQCFTVRG
jgi:hypothetical protein